MHFSVLISVYKDENSEWLDASLKSIFCQTVPPSEVVLVEDGALTEELEDVVKRYEQAYEELKVARYPVNRGLGYALHDGLMLCSNELVARMDSDDISHPDRFEKQLKVFSEHPDIDVCSAWIDEFETDPTKPVSTRRLPETHQEIYDFGKTRSPISHPVVMFRRQAAIDCGNYQHFTSFEDYDLWVRMLMSNCRFYNIQESLLDFRMGNDMMARRGGLKYASNEYHFIRRLHKIGYISLPIMLYCMLFRISIRLIPSGLRRLAYKIVRK